MKTAIIPILLVASLATVDSHPAGPLACVDLKSHTRFQAIRETECKMFYMHSLEPGSIWYKMDCPPGLQFNVNKCRCDYKQSNYCKKFCPTCT